MEIPGGLLSFLFLVVGSPILFVVVVVRIALALVIWCSGDTYLRRKGKGAVVVLPRRCLYAIESNENVVVAAANVGRLSVSYSERG